MNNIDNLVSVKPFEEYYKSSNNICYLSLKGTVGSLIASDKLETNTYFFFFKHLAYIFLGFINYSLKKMTPDEKITKIADCIVNLDDKPIPKIITKN